MEENNKKKNIIVFTIAAIIIIMGAVFYFTANKYKTASKQEEKTENAGAPTAPVGQVHNPAERLTDINPYDAKTNPFEAAATNPFKDVYKNPFSK